MDTKMLLIVNPISGTDDKKGLALKITDHLAQKGIAVETAYTQCRGDATRLAREGVAAGMDAVLACGGDGTVNETARAMRGTGVAMGIIPAGSGNGLARHLGIEIDPIRSLDVIAEGHMEDCDYGTINGTPFFCTCGMGYDAAVSDRFAASGKRGKISYIRSAVMEFLNYKHERYIIRTNGCEITDDAFLVACCNASQYGNNAYIAPQASLTDGLLDLIVVRKANLLETMAAGIDLMIGTLNHNRLIETYRVKEVEIERSASGPAHIDGEPITLPDHINIKCHPGQLRLFTPRIREDFKPLITPVEDLIRDIGLTIDRILQ